MPGPGENRERYPDFLDIAAPPSGEDFAVGGNFSAQSPLRTPSVRTFRPDKVRQIPGIGPHSRPLPWYSTKVRARGP